VGIWARGEEFHPRVVYFHHKTLISKINVAISSLFWYHGVSNKQKPKGNSPPCLAMVMSSRRRSPPGFWFFFFCVVGSTHRLSEVLVAGTVCP